ncbi:MAG: hypothetical protein ACTSYI_16050 [Promethearchaeota archaeon]
MILLDEQLSAVLNRYDDTEIIKSTRISIPLFPKANIILDFKKYPQKPKILLPHRMEKAVKDISVYLPAYRNWDKNDPLEFVSLLTAVQQTIETLAGQVVHLSEQIVKSICFLAKSANPNEMFCTLRLTNGCFQEFVLAPGLAASNRSAVFSPNKIGRDPTLAASCHSHPSGNNFPSQADMKIFARYRVNMILGAPFRTINLAVYNSQGDRVPILIHAFDPFWNEIS